MQLKQAAAGPARPANPIELERFLPYRLSVLTNRVSGTLARVYELRFGLTIPEWRVMAVLGRFPGLAAGEVAERSAMDKVTVSRAVARLVKSGRLVRHTDANDRRRAELAFTPAGAAIYAEIAPLARAYEARLWAALTPLEAKAFDALIDKLLARTDEIET